MSQQKSSFSGFFFLGLFIAVGLISGTYLISRSFERVKLAHQTITVKGLATKDIKADMGAWSGGFSVQEKDLEKAYTLYEQTEARVLTHLTSLGVSLSRLKRSPVHHYRHMKYDEKGRQTDQIAYFEVSRSYSYEEEDVKVLERLYESYPELLKKGINVMNNSVQYLYTKLDDIKADLLGSAAEDALNRAKSLADKTGSRVGLLSSARQGVFQVTPVNSQDVSDYGYNDTSSINKTAKAIVTASFSLEKK